MTSQSTINADRDVLREAPLTAATTWPQPVRTLPQCFEHTCDSSPGRVAVIVGLSHLTYAELDGRANQLAHLLRERGVTGEPPSASCLDDPRTPTSRCSACSRPGPRTSRSTPRSPPIDWRTSRRTPGCATSSRRPLRVTSRGTCPAPSSNSIGAGRPGRRAHPPSRPGHHPSSLCHVIYTSGSTGKPKAVPAISHASIVNFLRVATPIYGVTSEDRVYQGMSISFDFHLEEMWPGSVAGAALVAGPTRLPPFRGRG